MTTAKFKIESGVQLLARLSKKHAVENFHPILFEQGLNHGNVVEIISNDSSSYLLIDLICEALIPTINIAELIGVLMFDTTGHFNYQELILALQNRINFMLSIDLETELRKTEAERILQMALSNFFLLEIYDATQFYTTIHSLDNIFAKYSSISLLLFNTLSAFYWSEQGFKITKMDLYIKNLLGIIQKVSKEYKVILVYTRPAYFSSSKDIDVTETSEIMDGVHFKVQIIDNGKGVYQVNVKTLDSFYKKYFLNLDGIIKWHKL